MSDLFKEGEARRIRDEWFDETYFTEPSPAMIKDFIGKVLDKQEGGTHYASKSIQPIDYIQGNKLNYCEGNVVKYVTRHRDKNGKEDLLKAIHYLEFLIQDEYGDE
jgi:hypothetical protein